VFLLYHSIFHVFSIFVFFFILLFFVLICPSLFLLTIWRINVTFSAANFDVSLIRPGVFKSCLFGVLIYKNN